jgi:hypothetical protein
VPDHDWLTWHDRYDQPDSWARRRLAVVQRQIGAALDGLPPGPIRVVSMCAGQGHDLLGVLATHPRRADVTARLVELDPRNVAVARRAAGPGVEVVEGDASLVGSYDGMVPADLVVACGVFGNISDADIEHTVTHLPRLCRTGGTVVWTRHTAAPDITPSVRNWFRDNGFREIVFETAEDGVPFGVGSHVLTGPTLPYLPELRLFDFVGY